MKTNTLDQHLKNSLSVDHFLSRIDSIEGNLVKRYQDERRKTLDEFDRSFEYDSATLSSVYEEIVDAINASTPFCDIKNLSSDAWESIWDHLPPEGVDLEKNTLHAVFRQVRKDNNYADSIVWSNNTIKVVRRQILD